MVEKIVRTTDGHCCDWCANLAGTYEYGMEPKDVYRRHDNCGCQVTFISEKGAQDVHSKQYLPQKEIDERAKRKTVGKTNDAEEKAKIDIRKTVGLNNDFSNGGDGQNNNKKKAKPYAKELLAEARKHEPKVTADLEAAVSKGTGHLEGLKYNIKSEDSLIRKLVDKSAAKGLSLEDYSKKITDVLRYTNVSDSNRLTNDFFKIVDDLKQKGYNMVEVTNTFPNLDAPYRGINTLVQTKDGYVFELQFHTPQSLDVKEINHKLYEEERLAETLESKKRILRFEMKKNASSIKTPNDVESIIDVARKD